MLANSAAGADSPLGLIMQYAPFVLLLVLAYMLLVRPQMQRAKEHRQAVGGIKRGDSVVLASGVIGKVVRVEEAELGVEIAQGVTVKVVKTMVAEVRSRGAPAPANDAKP
jgi:preprotein translocase subunit YajC